MIKRSYFKINNDRIQSFNDFISNRFSFENLDEEDYIELRNLGSGSSFNVQLIYHIERGELFALKGKYTNDKKIPELIERENSTSTYSKILWHS